MKQTDDYYEVARKRVKEKKAFYGHLSAYLSTSVFLLLLNLLTSPGEWWFFYPILGWGIGIAIHFFSVFGFTSMGLGTPEWEEREMEKEMKRMQASRSRRHSTTPKPERLDLDDHLELKEVKKEKAGQYSEEDLV